jgi:radical SAM superfamily enzyme YgiQ (UPF0313 family)
LKKDPGGRLSVAVVYPGPAREGMASLALHGIHQLVNDYPRALCERVFFQETPLRSVESRRLLSSFDLLAFTVAFEEQWVLLPKMLKSAGIPPRFEERHAAHPVVLVGGFAARLNPAPVGKFADLIVAGDAECVLPDILDRLQQGCGKSREELFSALAGIEGVSVRSGTGRPGVARYENKGRPVAQRIFDPPSLFKRMVLVETGRGCPAGCRFCAVAHARKPPVFFPAGDVLDAAREGMAAGNKVGLVGASLSRHPELVLMLDGLAECGADISPASLGAGVLAGAARGPLLAHLERSKQRTITLAPETGSKRLQKVIGKSLPDAALERAVRGLGQAGILHLKLYLLYGLPDEEAEDLRDSIDLVARIRKWLLSAQRSRGRTGRLTVSINPFVPKPHTPLAQESMPALADLKRRRRILSGGLRRLGGVAVSGLSPRAAVWQCLLDRGDASLCDLLERADGRWPPPHGLVDEVIPHWRGLVHGRG